MEKNADVAARLARNSAAIGAKKAPKLYIVPKTTKPTVKATSTMVQARHESGTLAADGGIRADDPFTTFLPGGRLALASHQTTKPVAVAALRFLLPIECWHLEGDRCVPVRLCPWRYRTALDLRYEIS